MEFAPRLSGAACLLLGVFPTCHDAGAGNLATSSAGRKAPSLNRAGGAERAQSTSQRVYRMGVEQFFDWWGEHAPEETFSRSLVQRFRVSLEARALAPRTINLRLAAVRKLAEEAAAENLLPLEKVAQILSVKGAKILGGRAGNWLTRAQAEQLLALPDRATLKGKRDRALLALFLSAGLRREELAALTIERVQQRDGRWCLVDLLGILAKKFNHRRYYRHLVRTPWLAVANTSTNAKVLLQTKSGGKRSDIFEQLASRQQIFGNPTIIAGAYELYYDQTTESPKKGASGKGAGSPRRLAVFVNQINLTYDLRACSAEQFMDLLPKEYDRFKGSRCNRLAAAENEGHQRLRTPCGRI